MAGTTCGASFCPGATNTYGPETGGSGYTAARFRAPSRLCTTSGAYGPFGGTSGALT